MAPEAPLDPPLDIHHSSNGSYHIYNWLKATRGRFLNFINITWSNLKLRLGINFKTFKKKMLFH